MTAEASPHHLVLDENCLRTYDTHFKMAPPLRSEKDVEALRKGLAEGVIDIIATDHAPHGLVDKALEFDQAANGIVGLQTAIPLTYRLVDDGIVPLHRWLTSLTSAPAKLLGLPHGTLKKGVQADITIFDPGCVWTLGSDDLVSKSKNSPFLNWELKGRVSKTIVRGKMVYEQS